MFNSILKIAVSQSGRSELESAVYYTGLGRIENKGSVPFGHRPQDQGQEWRVLD